MNSRRDFIQKIATSALAFPLIQQTAFASSYTIADGPVLKVAIMGLGSYGTRVADAMQACKRAKLTGVISGTPSKITDWQKKYNIPEKNCYNYENFDEIKNNQGYRCCLHHYSKWTAPRPGDPGSQSG